jgi:hypothetical protein
MTPEFEYKIGGDTLAYHWTHVVAGFDMPIKVTLADSVYTFVHPTEKWQTAKLRLTKPDDFRIDPNFLAVAHKFGDPEPAAGGRAGGGARSGGGTGVFGGRAGGATGRGRADTGATARGGGA